MWSNKESSPATIAGDLGSNPDAAIKKINEKEWNSGMTPEEAIKDLKYDNERCLRICEGACLNIEKINVTAVMAL